MVAMTGVTELISPCLPRRSMAAGLTPSSCNWSEAARVSAWEILYSLSRRCNSAAPITSASNSALARSALRRLSSSSARAFRYASCCSESSLLFRRASTAPFLTSCPSQASISVTRPVMVAPIRARRCSSKSMRPATRRVSTIGRLLRSASLSCASRSGEGATIIGSWTARAAVFWSSLLQPISRAAIKAISRAFFMDSFLPG